ncbi:TonB-dependent siderophore receptor [Pseudomonas qingdaonensis]|uniref:TonB-dependent siderophore receptor n=1 Tax=Pseudomonas qingdaonensis TaxID=2056231 RepID=A0ABX8DKD9_9PSED|nr:TonB-dependent siderophore receptor [Pseudomonas qingdaonensis]QVL16723.1 TonB-dependent siderophore receptor [Pseudomonas qingdaonensis]
MFAPITRSMTLTLGLCGTACSAVALADNEPLPDAAPQALELGSTNVSAQGLGSTTENTGSYTTGSMSTATRLNLSIKDTPQSMSVLTRQQLDDFQLDNLSEAMGQVTGVVVQRNDSERPTYNSRGYAIDNFQIDGMLNTFAGLKSDSDTIIYDRIEVVRGATGLTTGAGDPSGTINMMRKRPTHELAVKTGLRGGSYDNYYSYVDVGGPLAFDGRLRGRSVLAYRDAHSFRDRYQTQREVAYGILEGDLSDDTVLAVGYDYQNKHVQGASWGTVPYWNASGGKAKLPRSNNISAPWSSWPLKDETVFATLDQRLGGDWHLKAAYTYRQSETDGKVYFGGQGFPEADRSGMNAWVSHFIGDEKMRAADLNLGGPFALLGREHEFMIGYGESQRRNSAPLKRPLDLPPGYTTIPDWKYLGGVDKFADTVTNLDGSRDTTQQNAGYVATRLNVTDALHLVLGSRYGSWKVTGRSWAFDAAGQVVENPRSSRTHNDVWTPYAGVLYDITDQYTVYASYTDIFKPQNYKDVDDKYLEPVVGSNYEVGLKGSLLDERLNLSTAVFRSKQDNVAEVDDSIPVGPNGEQYYKSGGKGNTVEGFEAEVAGEVMAGWNMTLGYSYTHSLDAEHKRRNTTQPLNMVRWNSSYRVMDRLTVGGSVDWQSDIYRSGNRPVGRGSDGRIITAPADIRQRSYTVVGLMSRYEFDEHLSASLNVKNLLDTRYYNNVGFYNGVYWGDPRTLTVSLDWRL